MLMNNKHLDLNSCKMEQVKITLLLKLNLEAAENGKLNLYC